MISEGKFSVPFNPSGKAGLQLPWFPEEKPGDELNGRILSTLCVTHFIYCLTISSGSPPHRSLTVRISTVFCCLKQPIKTGGARMTI